MYKIKLTKKLIKVLISIISGNKTLSEIANNLDVSTNSVSKILIKLEDEGFILRHKSKTGVKIKLSNRSYVLHFKEFYLSNIHIDISNLFSGRSLDVLLTIANKGKKTNIMADMLEIQPRAVREKLGHLIDRGIVSKEKGIYFINENIPKLKDFLLSIKNYYDGQGILYKNTINEQLIYVHEPNLVKGYLTGFNAYQKYNMSIRPKSYLYSQKNKEPKIEDVFVHSLFEINDARTLGIAITFFAKNNLYLNKYYERLLYLGLMFEVDNLINEIRHIYNKFLEIHKLQPKTILNSDDSLPKIDSRILIRMFDMYDVGIK